jgi:uncharacterized membrane protein YbjE (DUF340 family)
MEDKQAFEMAHYRNSYPAADEQSQKLTNKLQTAATVVIVYEIFQFVWVAYATYTFSTSTSHETDLVHYGSTALLFCSALKASTGFNLHHHASEVTHRTPENTKHLTKSVFFTDAVSLVVCCAIAFFVYQHDSTLCLPLLASSIGFKYLDSTFASLRCHEKSLERIVDLSAHETKLA